MKTAKMKKMDSLPRMFASKARTFAARLALIHHALSLYYRNGTMEERISLLSMEAGIAWARWFLNEQLRVYGAASSEYDKKIINDNVFLIKTKLNGVANTRTLMRVNSRKYRHAGEAHEALDQIVLAGLATWDERRKKITLK